MVSLKNNNLSESNIHAPLTTALFALWNIWKARNLKAFEDVNPNPMEAMFTIKIFVAEFLSCRKVATPHPSISTGLNSGSSLWRPPRSNFIKINTDAQFDPNSGHGFSGIVCRDEYGRLISGVTSQIYASSAFVVEALALREAISLAVTLNLPSVVVESDCQELIKACRGNIRRREIEQIMKDIQRMKENLTWLGFLLTNRACNSVADIVLS